MVDEAQFDFQKEIEEILHVPGVNKKKIAEWAVVDPSTVTRWCQGTTPSDPIDVLNQLRRHVEEARRAAVDACRTEVDSWLPLTADLNPGLREYVEHCGLLAGSYYVIASWIPSSEHADECDVVIARYFHGLWVDMSRRVYNIGDQDQIVSLSSDAEAPTFDQAQALSEIVDVRIAIDKEVGRSVARLHVQLNLDQFRYSNDSIGFIDGFGYRFRATKAILRRPLYAEQTNDFLGAPIPIPCRRLNLITCIPKSCLRGSPSALSSSNRSMLKVLMELDNAEPDTIESLLWPRGQRYELSNAPDAPLKPLARVTTTINSLPNSLQQALKQPADLTQPDQTIRDVLCASESTCFLLDLYEPHPSLTCSIVWRLPRKEERAG